MNDQLRLDVTAYREFFAEHQDGAATDFANTANDAYLKTSGDEAGIASYGEVSDLLVSWYVQEIYLPAHKEEDITFDPENKDHINLITPDVDVTPTEPPTEVEE